MPTIKFATRPSKLAHTQTNIVMQNLQQHWGGLNTEKIVITTKGDRILNQPIPEIGGKGLFTHELEEALRSGNVDAAVHSLKDLPVENSDGLTIGVIPKRVDPRDVVFSPAGETLETLPMGAIIGTSSLRRQAQILAYRSDLIVRPIRGNVETRIRKAREGEFDAVVLAYAGLRRLDLDKIITQIIPMNILLPAPGQGALAVQCREDDAETLELLNVLECLRTRASVTAERAFLSALGGGCSLPVGAFAKPKGEVLELKGVVAAVDGSNLYSLEMRGVDPGILGNEMANKMLELGAGELLVEV